MKCKNCKHFTGVKCHGHGEYWGSCKLIDSLFGKYQNVYVTKNIDLKNSLTKLGYSHLFINNVVLSLFDYICYDDTDCKYKRFIDDIYSRGIILKNDYEYFCNDREYRCCTYLGSLYDSLE